MARMLVFADVNVPLSVSTFFAGREHDVRQTRDVFGAQAADAVIVAGAAESRAVVLTMDKDYIRLAQRAMEAGQSRKRSWGLILLRCREPQALARVQVVCDLIEFEYDQASALHPDCLLVNVHVHDRHIVIKR
jgi:predicted nuclease of predicted toxin-antitoxin system